MGLYLFDNYMYQILVLHHFHIVELIMGSCWGFIISKEEFITPSNTEPFSPKSISQDSDSKVQSFLGFDSKPPVKSNKQRALKVSISGKAAEERYREEKSMKRWKTNSGQFWSLA